MRALRNNEVIHSQLSHVMVLFVEFIRLLGVGPRENERYESDKEWQQRRGYLNRQCQRVSKWIFTFNPSEAS